MPPLTVMMKPSSSACNMKCSYCFYHDESSKREIANYGMMSEDTLRSIIRKTIFRAEQYITYAYQGGEPLLRGIDFYKKALELQRKYNKNNLIIHNSLQTNGTLLNDEWCQFFADNHFLIGVSVDGVGDVHDSARIYNDGGPTHKDIMEGIKLLEEYDVAYNILTVVNKAVAANIERIYEFYKEKGWRYQQYILCLPPLGETCDNQPYAPTPEEYGEFLIMLYDLWLKDINDKYVTAPSIRQFDNYHLIQQGMPAESCDMRGICSRMMVVESDGSVYPCDFFMTDEYKLGNFNEDRMDAIDSKREELGFIERSSLHSKACKSCEYYWICRCGCQRSRILIPEEGRYLSNYCEAYKMFFKHMS